MKEKSLNLEGLVQLKCFVYASIISADNDEYAENVKQEVIRRYKDAGEDITNNSLNWEYIFEPLGEGADKYIQLMKS